MAAAVAESVAVLIASSAKSDAKDVLARRSSGNNNLAGVLADVGLVNGLFTGRLGIAVQKVFADVKDTPAPAVMSELKLLFDGASINKVVYYSGHGTESGAWCFGDAKTNVTQFIKPVDIEKLWTGRKNANGRQRLIIVSDSCYSGRWAVHFHRCDNSPCKCARKFNDVYVQASVGPNRLASDTELGGEFTRRWVLVPHGDRDKKSKGKLLKTVLGYATIVPLLNVALTAVFDTKNNPYTNLPRVFPAGCHLDFVGNGLLFTENYAILKSNAQSIPAYCAVCYG